MCTPYTSRFALYFCTFSRVFSALTNCSPNLAQTMIIEAGGWLKVFFSVFNCWYVCPVCAGEWWGCDPVTPDVSSVVLKGRFAVLNLYMLLQTTKTIPSHSTLCWLWPLSQRSVRSSFIKTGSLLEITVFFFKREPCTRVMLIRNKQKI